MKSTDKGKMILIIVSIAAIIVLGTMIRKTADTNPADTVAVETTLIPSTTVTDPVFPITEPITDPVPHVEPTLIEEPTILPIRDRKPETDIKPVPIEEYNQGQMQHSTIPAIDVVFVVDTTGSMGDEIQVVKNEMKNMINVISSGQPKPYVRYGLVAYRDYGDDYVTLQRNFSDNQKEIISNINRLRADGGGDTPEAVDEALHVALNKMSWSNSANTSKIVFLIGDAGPRPQPRYNINDMAQKAGQRGIKIVTIGCSGITNHGEKDFREIASLSGGNFDYLTYQQVLAKADGSKVELLEAGGKTFEVTNEAEKGAWKMGYKDMVDKKMAREVAPAKMPSLAGADGHSYPTGAARAKVGRASIAKGDMIYDADVESEPAGRVVSASEKTNNLDTILTQHIQTEAKKQGVKYKEPK